LFVVVLSLFTTVFSLFIILPLSFISTHPENWHTFAVDVPAQAVCLTSILLVTSFHSTVIVPVIELSVGFTVTSHELTDIVTSSVHVSAGSLVVLSYTIVMSTLLAVNAISSSNGSAVAPLHHNAVYELL